MSRETNATVEACLADAIERMAPNRIKRAQVRLPSNIVFQLLDDSHGVSIEMPEAAVCKNMQDNESAFEGWALALWTWLGTTDSFKVVLRWTPLSSDCNLHYNRFLYRAIKFRSWFNWFSTDPALEKEISDFQPFVKKVVHFYANVRSFTRKHDENARGSSEHYYENYFVFGDGRKQLLEALGIKGKEARLEPQIPVGLFQERVSGSTYFFPGRKSAIDFCVFETNQVHIFELKRPKAKPMVGHLTEALFYSAFISELREGKAFAFEKEESLEDIELALTRADLIHAYILAGRLHPLFDANRTFEELNRSLMSDRISLHFISMDQREDGKIELKQIV